MKTIKVSLLALTLACSSLLWGATERQEEIINKMNTFLETEEANYKTKESVELSDRITHVYWDLEAEDFTFLPIYEASYDWKECLPKFLEKELELDIANLELSDEGNYYASFLKEDGTELKIQPFFADEAAEFIRSTHILSSLNLKHIRAPKIEAVARLKSDYGKVLIAQEKPKGKSLFSHLMDFNFTFFTHEKNAKMEEMIDIYYQFGLAVGELFSKSSEQAPLHPSVKSSQEDDLNEIQDTLEEGPYMGITHERLTELFTHYQNILKEKPLKHCYHFDDSDDWDYTYNTETKTVSVDDPTEILWTMDSEKRPNTPQFMAYKKTVGEILDNAFIMNEWEREAFKAAFDRGYIESGCALPTAEEEEIYRFFNGLSSLEEIIDDDNLQWLWEQCQAE